MSTLTNILSEPLLAALLGFLLGTLSRLLVEISKNVHERNSLIELFICDVNEHWSRIDSLVGAPIGKNFLQIRWRIADEGLVFGTRYPEYEFEVHNLKLYETEGFRLARHVSEKPRLHFWKVYSLMRDAEAARQAVKSLAPDDPDRVSYQRAFVSVVKQLAVEFIRLATVLHGERPWYKRWFAPIVPARSRL